LAKAEQPKQLLTKYGLTKEHIIEGGGEGGEQEEVVLSHARAKGFTKDVV